jgi:hypothetical protein
MKLWMSEESSSRCSSSSLSDFGDTRPLRRAVAEFLGES